MPLADSNRIRLLEDELARTRGAHDRTGQRMLAALVQTGGQAQYFALGKARCGDGAIEGRLAFGKRSRFVDEDGVDLAQLFDGGSVAKQHALRGGLAGGDHDRHRRGQAESARAGDDQYGDRIDQPEYRARLRPK
jgi:hypothetical protein